MAAWDTITDDFPGSALSALWEGSYGTASVVSGNRVAIDAVAYSGINSVNHNLTNSSIVIRAEVSPGGGSSGVDLREDGATLIGRIEFVYTGGNIEFKTPAGSTFVTYSATTMAWWRYRHTTDTLYLETSPDGITWTVRKSEAVASTVVDVMDIEVTAGPYLSTGTTAYFSKLNLAPTLPVLVTIARVHAIGTVVPTATSTPTPAVIARVHAVSAVTPTATATPPLTVVARTSVIPVPSVSSGSGVTNATPALIVSDQAVLAPAITASATVVVPALDRAGTVLQVETAFSSGPLIATPYAIRSLGKVLAPLVAGHDAPLMFSGLLKRWSGSVWQAGQLKVRATDTLFSPGQMHMARTATGLQRHLVDDQKLPHQGLLQGVPEYFDWGLGPRIKGFNTPGPLGNWVAAIPWGEIYPQAGVVPTGNTQCVIRRIGAAVLSATTQTWTVISDVTGLNFYGAYYQDDFSGNAVSPVPLGRDGSNNVTGIPSGGYNMHFFPNNRATINPADIAGIVAWFEARLETVPGHVDDTATAKFLAGAGGDYWVDLTIGYGTGLSNGDWAIGRHSFLDTYWRAFFGHTLTRAQILRNPPPITMP